MTDVLIGLFSGTAFGFVIQRVGATNPQKMVLAHLMKERHIPQFMLLVVIFSAIGLFGLDKLHHPERTLESLEAALAKVHGAG